MMDRPLSADPIDLDSALGAFYRRNGFGEEIGARPRTVPVYTGCLLVPLPNIEARRRFLKYHDLHHLITGYSVGRIGEGEVSAWELGSGSMFVSPTLGLMNLIALSTGLFLEPARMWYAFRRGCRSRNLYPARRRADVDANRWPDLQALRDFTDGAAGDRVPGVLRGLEFGTYACAAVAIHALIALPAMVTRFGSDLLLGKSLIEAIKPVRRSDLF